MRSSVIVVTEWEGYLKSLPVAAAGDVAVKETHVHSTRTSALPGQEIYRSVALNNSVAYQICKLS